MVSAIFRGQGRGCPSALILVASHAALKKKKKWVFKSFVNWHEKYFVVNTKPKAKAKPCTNSLQFCRKRLFPWSSPRALLTHGELLVPFFFPERPSLRFLWRQISFHLDSFESAHVDESATL